MVQQLVSNGIEKASARKPAFWPAIPMRFNDLRIPKSVVVDLILRHMHLDGITSLEVTSRTLKTSAGYRVTVEHRRGVEDAGLLAALEAAADQVRAAQEGRGEAA